MSEINDLPGLIEIQKIRLSQDFADEAGVVKKILHIPVRKPNKQEFVRVHRSLEYRLEIGLIELKEENEVYLLDPSIRSCAEENLSHVMLHTSINRQGTPFLWPCKMPKSDGRTVAWHTTAFDAVKQAEDNWVRVVANLNLGAYEVRQASAIINEPEWPTLTFLEIINIAFRDRYISDPNHIVLRQLRGEI